jgi:hypothetical protein
LNLPFALALPDDEFHRAPADVLHRAEAKADVRFRDDRAILVDLDVLDLEIPARGVDLGREDRHAHAARVRNIQRDLFGLAGGGGQGGRHVLGGIMRLEEGGLDRDHTVIGGVTVMNENVIRDEVVRFGDLKIVGLFFANVFDEGNPIPIQIAFRIAFDIGVVEIITQPFQGIAPETNFTPRIGRVKLTRGDPCLLSKFIPCKTRSIPGGTDVILYRTHRDNILCADAAGGMFFVSSTNVSSSLVADKVTTYILRKRVDIFIACNKDLIPYTSLFVWEFHGSHAADNAKAQ